MNWIIYTRKSDDDKKVTEKSIAEQVQECQKMATRDALSVVAYIEESKSAKVAGKRPLFSAMVRRIERGEAQGILCWHVNRLARNMTEGGRLADLMAEGKLREIRTPTSVFKTGDNIIPLVVEAGTSTQYSLDVVRNVSRGMKGHYESGGTTYKAPAGYRNQRDPDNLKRGIVVVDEPRFNLIRRGFHMLETSTATLSQVRTFLNDTCGYQSRQGRPLSLPGAYKLFRDPFYAGFVRYKGNIRKGNHVPMLTDEQFNRVQAALEARMRPRKKAVKKGRAFAFTGLMRCGYCGQQITAEHHTLTNGQSYTAYRCSDSWRRCTKQGMSAPALQEAIRKQLTGLQIHPSLVEVALDTMLRSMEAQHKQLQDDGARDDAHLRDTEHKIRRLEEMYLSGLLESEERYSQHLITLKAEREKWTIRSAGTRLTLEEAKESVHNTARFVVRAAQEFNLGNDAAQRETASALATEYRFYGREKRIELVLNPLLDGFVTFARALPRMASRQLSLPVVRTGAFSEMGLFELSKNGSRNMKNAPLREAFFTGGPAEQEVDTPLLSVGKHDTAKSDSPAGLAELIELFFTQKFPKVQAVWSEQHQP
jgi:site-specific DNA recombinase